MSYWTGSTYADLRPFVSSVPDSWSLQELRWTTDPPTEPGLYWAKPKGERALGIYLEYSKTSGLYFGDYLLNEINRDWNITHWLGPLPQPEPPKDK